MSDVAQYLQRERRQRDRSYRETDEQQRIVVARGAVETELSTAEAAVHEAPLAVAANGNG
jgi:hypothetical protein